MRSEADWERPSFAASPVLNVDLELLKEEVHMMSVRTVLEFGPGESTDFLARLNRSGEFVRVTTCEHIDKWYEVAKKRFKDYPNVRVLKYRNELPVVVEGLGDDEKFDLGFVDSPQGWDISVRTKFPGYEDTSRFNTALFALQRCRAVILHDSNRPLERGTLGRLNALGYDYHFLKHPNAGMMALILHEEGMKLNGNAQRPDLQGVEESGSPPPRPEPEQRGVSVDLGPDRLDGGGTRKKGRGVHKGRGSSGKRVRSAPRARSGVEGSA